jgi:hypothetical protein
MFDFSKAPNGALLIDYRSGSFEEVHHQRIAERKSAEE